MIHLESINLPHNLNSFSEVIDVRSPEEFALDHLPGAVNLPVLNDAERKEVGTLYKQCPFSARKLGAEIISRNVANHLHQHLREKDLDYEPLLYCWRGGMRSRSMTMILKSIGWKAHYLNGGYRSFRQHVVTELEEQFTQDLNLQVISGLTGVGKTRLLHALRDAGGQILDLEGLANHKGSLLGAAPTSSQPQQKRFETKLWKAMNKLDPKLPIFIEAESNRIGNVHCPPALWTALHKATVTNIDLPIDQRIILLRQEYPHFQDKPDILSELLEVLVRLRGHEQVAQWQDLIEHNQWDQFVESILIHHYDICYRIPGDEKSNYQSASKTLNVRAADAESFKIAATELLKA